MSRLRPLGWWHQVSRPDPQRLGQAPYRRRSRLNLASLDPAQVGLPDAGFVGQFRLGQRGLLAPEAESGQVHHSAGSLKHTQNVYGMVVYWLRNVYSGYRQGGLGRL